MSKPIKLSYYSDLLCVWAYVSQIRLDELIKQHGSKLQIEYHFVSIYGSTEQRITKGWQQRGGIEAYADWVLAMKENYPHVLIHPGVWRECMPKTSSMGHLFLKAVQILEQRGLIPTAQSSECKKSIFEDLMWRIRCAFFEKAQDIGELMVLYELAESMNLPVSELQRLINDGSAMAALSEDMALKERHQIEGSPSYLLNDGRQKLYGNVGYRVIEANVLELLENPEGQASWC
ncbi:MAG: disulfide bond formation protein DsbA [Gammaproteobacteria bacterium]|nr:disulfide bond formation protein DsbA [Gammaproteobacteria bacterium]